MFQYLHYLFGVTVIFLLSAAGLQAQDKPDYIYLLNGEEIEARVDAIDGDYIRYFPFGESGGEVLRVAKKELDRVKMANGTEVWFNRLPKEAKPEETAAEPPPAKKKKLKNPISARKLSRQ